MNKNEYHLTISIEDGFNDSGISQEKNNNSGNTKDLKFGTMVLAAYKAVEPFIETTKQIILNNAETQSGSAELTMRQNLGLIAIQKVANVGISMLAGKTLTMALGLGSGVGAVVGGALAIGQMALNIYAKQNEINNQALKENEQLNILRGRAGAQFNRSRSGE